MNKTWMTIFSKKAFEKKQNKELQKIATKFLSQHPLCESMDPAHKIFRHVCPAGSRIVELCLLYDVLCIVVFWGLLPLLELHLLCQLC